MNHAPRLAIIVVAAGSGARFGGSIPKQFAPLGGLALCMHSIQRFQRYLPYAHIVLVTRPDYAEYLDGATLKNVTIVHGGASRQASVQCGLDVLSNNPPDTVFIHDAARPFVSQHVCIALLDALKHHRAALPTLHVADTLKQVNDNSIISTINRDTVRIAQTPQAFDYKLLFAAYQDAEAEFTDDAGVMQAAGHDVLCVEGDAMTFKITIAEDMQRAQQYLCTEQRIGQGYDVHAFEDFAIGQPHIIKLGGIDVPHTRTLNGHSDADVVLHAITDALLGAIGEGDIGQHFPPSNDVFKGMDSEHFVAHALALLHQKGGAVVNCDVTIIGERPKISSVRDAMRINIARILQCAAQRINVKATTTEKLGFEGKEEGLACSAIISVTLPMLSDI
jgi:2-C-methyl-D-erythritol 4-phosphate cytidylyltransferase / 2-C-methyl-D-erythritol 2,4-cyclodiphosphate synthase